MKQYFQLLEKLDHLGSNIKTRNLETRELLGESILITNEANFYSVPGLREVGEYLRGELAWYFSGDRRPEFIIKYSKFWDKLRNHDGTVNSNYGHMVFYDSIGISQNSQYEWCKKQLQKDQYSRQAIIVYNQPKFYYDDNKDFICTQTQQFFIRDNMLQSIVYIRSSDAIRGLTFDIPFWSIVQQNLLLELQSLYPGLTLGWLKVVIGSSHIYQEHFQLVDSIAKSPKQEIFVKLKKPIPLYKSATEYEKILDDLVGFYEI